MAKSLTIDPFLNYATYLGGNGGDVAYAIAVQSSTDNTYVAGETLSTNFPPLNAYQGGSHGNGDAFVSKLNSTGTKLLYSTYLGGSGSDTAFALAIDAGGDAYVTGQTSSADFPIYPPAKTTSTSPTPAFQTVYGGAGDAFVTELLSSGNKLVYSTYLGGNGADWGYAIAVDSSNNAYVTGATQSGNFPTQSPYQSSLGAGSKQNAFVTKVNPGGTALVYSTYLGGSQTDTGQGIEVDSSGDAYVAGYTFSPNFPMENPIQSVFGGVTSTLLLASSTPKAPAWSSPLTWEGANQTTLGGWPSIAQADVRLSPPTFMLSATLSRRTFQSPPGCFRTLTKGTEDAFVSKLAPSGASLVYSTYLGGSNVDSGKGIAVDSLGNAVAVGSTQSSDFPVFDALQSILGLTTGSSCSVPPCADAFVTLLNPRVPKRPTPLFSAETEADFAQGVAVDTATPPNVYWPALPSPTTFRPPRALTRVTWAG